MVDCDALGNVRRWRWLVDLAQGLYAVEWVKR